MTRIFIIVLLILHVATIVGCILIEAIGPMFWVEVAGFITMVAYAVAFWKEFGEMV